MRRIVIVRTDRIGDVVLSTPVIQALRRAYSDAFIAMMVAPHARELVEGNPSLNEVIVFDKGKAAGIADSIRFARRLRAYHFDTAVILHPTVRVHIITAMALIKRRIGYDTKWGFLLTERVPHEKQFGAKHEIDYNLDLLKTLGIQARDRRPFIAVKPENRLKVAALLEQNGFGKGDSFVAIHPGASCPSKRWPGERFARVADEIAKRFHTRVVIVAGANNRDCGLRMSDAMEHDALDLSGDLGVGELMALLERARLLISNDSGPVHIAVALGIPVVAIFGRNQPGLSFKRWGPVGDNDVVLYKDVGCLECLAHDCKTGFQCLMAIEPHEVIEAAAKLLTVAR